MKTFARKYELLCITLSQSSGDGAKLSLNLESALLLNPIFCMAAPQLKYFRTFSHNVHGSSHVESRAKTARYHFVYDVRKHF